MEIPVFQCCACGRCCSNIRGLASDEEKEFIRQYGKGKLPLVQIQDPSEMTFPLWDFEAKRFRQYEKDMGIDAHIVPARGIMDLKSNRFIIVTYQMKTIAACPFQSESKKCSIYHTKRAFICHLFPFNRSPFSQGTDSAQALFGHCHTLDSFKQAFHYNDKTQLRSELRRSFGPILENAVQHDFLIEWSNNLVIKLTKDGIVRPALNYPEAHLMRRIRNCAHIDFTDFLVST